jgi:hypothetical protein
MFLLASAAWSQQDAPEATPLTFGEVVQADGVSRDELYTRAKIWFAATFVDSKHVLEVEDKAEGLLIGKGSFAFEPRGFSLTFFRSQVVFILKVSLTDGRYKYDLRDFRHKGSVTFSPRLGSVAPIDVGLITNSSEAPAIGTLSQKRRPKLWEQLKQLSNLEAVRLMASLKAGMQKSSKGPDAW